jgi:hypothetical protein
VRQRVSLFAAALWWGSLTAIGAVVVPLLFAYLPTPADAGRMAARLFTAQTWVSVACGFLLLLATRDKHAPARMDAARGALIFIVGGMLLALLVEFAVAPRIVARENLRLWHSAGSAMYLAQWVCAAVTLWKLSPAAASSPTSSSASPS